MHVCDQGSSNGTFLFKRRLQAGVWEALQDGTQVRCGTDAHVYVVQAPAEAGEFMQAAQQQAPGALVGVVSGEAAKEAQEGGGVWGQQRRRASSEAKAEHWLASLDYKGLTDKERRATAELQEKMQRLGALRTEARRIEAKESGQGGLTAG